MLCNVLPRCAAVDIYAYTKDTICSCNRLRRRIKGKSVHILYVIRAHFL